MRAIVLAAGKGTRLFPLTGEAPKPMAPVVDTPIIRHIFDLLARHGVSEAYVNVHYLADALLETYGEESKVNGMGVHLMREEHLTGTAGGVKHLAGVMQRTSSGSDEPFVVVSGDALTDIDIGDLVAFHREKGALATIALHRVYDTSEFGVVEIDEKENILGFQEKPDPKEAISTLANTGVYVPGPTALEYIPENAFFDFARNVFPCFLEEGERFVDYQGILLVGCRDARGVPPGPVRRALGESAGKGAGEEVGREPVGRGERPDPPIRGVGGVRRGGKGRRDRTRRLAPGRRDGRYGLLDPAKRHHKAEYPTPRRLLGEDCIVGYGYDVRSGETIRGGALIRWAL